MWNFSLLAIIWSLWKERNVKCFDATSSSVEVVVEVVIDRAKFLVASRASVLPLFRGFSLDSILLNWKEVALQGDGVALAHSVFAFLVSALLVCVGLDVFSLCIMGFVWVGGFFCWVSIPLLIVYIALVLFSSF